MSKSHFSMELGRQMTRKNATAPWLSAKSGVPVNSIRHWLSKNRIPQDWESVVRIGRALELTQMETDELFEAIDTDLVGRDKSPREWSVSRLKQSVTTMNQIKLLGYWQGPFLVPPRPDVLLGRDAIIAQATTVLTGADGTRCCVLQGMAGVGKTAIAQQIAHTVREQFVDGVLWADFQQDADDEIHIRTILLRFAQAYELDVSPDSSLDDLSYRVRDKLNDKNVLIVLDDVVTGRQIDWIRPSGERCALLITTRLKTVRTPPKAEWIEVVSFDGETDAAVDLFRYYLGNERVEREVESFRAMAGLVGHLPLAIVILARRLAVDEDWSAANLLAEELRPEHDRLEALEYDDLDVRASFNLSYQRLSERERRYFAELGVFEGEAFDTKAATYVLERSANKILRKFHGLGLVERVGKERYRLHPLLAQFAQDFLSGQDSYARKIRYYVNHAHDNRYDDSVLFADLDNIRLALHHAQERQLNHEFARGVAATHRFLFDYGLHDVVEQQLTDALSIAQNGRNRDLTARLLTGLGHISARRGKRDEAMQFVATAEPFANEHETQILIGRLQGELAFYDGMEACIIQFEQTLALARETNNADEIGVLCYNLAAVYAQIGRLNAPEPLLRESRQAAEQSGNLRLRALNFALQGDVSSYLGYYAVAQSAYEQALQLAHKVNNVRDLTMIMMRLGYLAKERGQYGKSLGFYKMALEKAEKLLNSSQSVLILADMGMLFVQQGMYDKAQQMVERGETINEQLEDEGGRIELLHTQGWLAIRGHRDWEKAIVLLEEAAALRCTREQTIYIALALGEAYLQTGNVDTAETQFTTAYDHAEAAGYVAEIELSRYGLARVSNKQDNSADAIEQGTQCVQRLTEIGHYRTTEARVWLRSLQ